jgi:23S rRNA (pseudouridine1915-N3)-methyltransferase
MLDITLAAVGSLKNSNFKACLADYELRLRPYVRLKIVELAAEPFSEHSKELAKNKEGERLIKFLSDRKKDGSTTKVYLLAENGLSFTSVELAGWLQQNESLILVLGGALGFSEQLVRSYPKLSLSPLTFPHELARVVLLEQLYRAATIINQKSYHY